LSLAHPLFLQLQMLRVQLPALSFSSTSCTASTTTYQPIPSIKQGLPPELLPRAAPRLGLRLRLRLAVRVPCNQVSEARSREPRKAKDRYSGSLYRRGPRRADPVPAPPASSPSPVSWRSSSPPQTRSRAAPTRRRIRRGLPSAAAGTGTPARAGRGSRPSGCSPRGRTPQPAALAQTTYSAVQLISRELGDFFFYAVGSGQETKTT
jgi:hypothetical protein